MNYKIIQDEAELQKFINMLPENTPDETFYVCLFARKKYAPDSGLIADKSQLKRFVATKDMIIDKIRQLEVAYGAYTFGKEKLPVPHLSMALYITPNPRSYRKAGAKVAKDLFDRLLKGETVNPRAASMNALQTECSRKIWYDFEVDSKYWTCDMIEEHITFACGIYAESMIVETRGGYHVMIELDTIKPAYKKTWYNKMMEIPDIDMKGDLLLPVPGCCQGGFVPKVC